MSSPPALISEAIAMLDRVIGQASIEALAQALRALQRMGMEKNNLQVHLERRRAVNSVRENDPRVDRDCVTALDMVEGLAGDFSLNWDAATMAQILLPRVITDGDLEAAISPALVRNDMLPPRPQSLPSEKVLRALLDQARSSLTNELAPPVRAQFFRVPKIGFTSRPAALLAPADRVWWESLANALGDVLDISAPGSVLWPRTRELTEFSNFTRAPLDWADPYIVRADIESFYDGIDHSVLAVALSSLGANSRYTRATEAFLDAVMGSSRGLPQGPPASEIFASCYLLMIDRRMEQEGLRYVRYADDYAIAANSVSDGRRKIESLESMLREVGLRLHPEKTKILRASTYANNVGTQVSPRVQSLHARLGEIARSELRGAADSQEVENQLRQMGVDEITLGELLYQRHLDIDEMIEQVTELLNPTLTRSYLAFVQEQATALQQGSIPDDRRAQQNDLDESLVYLAGAATWVGEQALQTILTWNPTLAPTASAYVRSVGRTQPEVTRDFVGWWLTDLAGSDWVKSWGCFAAEAEPSIVDDTLEEVLRTVALSEEHDELTRAGAARALASAGRLESSTWAAVAERSSRPMRLELLLDMEASPERFKAVADETRKLLLPQDDRRAIEG